MTKDSVRKATLTGAQVALTAGLMFYSVHNVRYVDVLNNFKSITGTATALCIALGALQIGLLVERWRIVLASLNQGAPRQALLKGVLIERLFAQLLPAAIGGDAARAAYFVGQKFDVAMTVLSIIYDRVSGILGLILLSGVCALFFRKAQLPATLAVTPVLLLLTMLAIMSVVISLPRAWIESLFGIVPGLRLKKFVAAGHDLLRDHRYTVSAMTLSALVQFLSCVMLVAIAHNVAPQVSEIKIALSAPILLLAMVMPLTIAGWGVREQAAIFVFAYAGATASSAVGISLLFGFLQLVLGLFSALIFLAVSWIQRGTLPRPWSTEGSQS